MAGDVWTDLENNVIVADYFAMLQDDLSGSPSSKAEHNEQLQSHIWRSRGSIEFKHQNISAVLRGLGEIWIEGYKPAVNYQMSLVDAVLRWISDRPEWSVHAPSLKPPHHMNDGSRSGSDRRPLRETHHLLRNWAR